MDRSFVDKIAVVTGGASGIGFGVADKFLENEAKLVVLLDINEEEGKKAQNILNSRYGDNKSIFMKCDVTKDLEVIYTTIIDKFKSVDVLVNNAGIMNEESIRKTVEINVVALVEWSMKFLEHMRVDKGGKGGTIINLSSTAGFRTSSLFPFYTASKFAVTGFTKSLGHCENYEIYGVRVVALCPFFTETRMPYTSKVTNPREIAVLKRVIEMKSGQTVEAVGEAAVQVFLQAESGTAWLIEAGKLEQIS